MRQFAANTEREIAGLERELREMKAKVTQITLERDRLESQLRDVREDSETRIAQLPRDAARRTSGAQPDLSRYTALVARAAELEQKLVKMREGRRAARRQLAEARAPGRAAPREEDEPTNTGTGMPLEFAEHLNVLEESIDSLRANMRAASDETAMMDQTESVDRDLERGQPGGGARRARARRAARARCDGPAELGVVPIRDSRLLGPMRVTVLPEVICR